jgi:hypothetical protein
MTDGSGVALSVGVAEALSRTRWLVGATWLSATAPPTPPAVSETATNAATFAFASIAAGSRPTTGPPTAAAAELR